MSHILDILDRYIRRNSLLPRMTWLRDRLRMPYHKFLKVGKSGLSLRIGNVMPVRLPGEFCSKELEQYETETAGAIINWVKQNPGGMFVDIGCSYGYFCCGVLFNDPKALVVAIDADLPSLAITRYVCHLAPDVDKRLELYRTLIGNESSSSQTAALLLDDTLKLLSDPAINPDPKNTNYVNLDTKVSDRDLSRISLDDFLCERLVQEKLPCLIKCDVEGAELLVLQGATNILQKHKPVLLMSVHPQYLPKFGGSVELLEKLLNDAGYTINIIAIDHEEHWLCH